MRKPSPVELLILAFSLTACDAAPSGGIPSGVKLHRIQQGETLYSIASEEYGDPLEWPRLRDANPWVDPENLLPGDELRIPSKGSDPNYFNLPPSSLEAEGPGAPAAMDPESDRGGGVSNVFRNLMPKVSGRKLFGQPVETLAFLTMGAFLAHALIQGFLLWLVGTVTFLRDISLKKAMAASFQTGMITLFTVVVLGGVGLLMIHIGTTAPGSAGGADLLDTVETYLTHPVGATIAGFSVFGLYLLLCMRFIPQVFGLERAQSMTLVFLAVLAPHLAGLYTLGQRFGMIS